MIKVKNAVIMAAGTSSRFAPLSFEKPKALIRVKGEVLIERQIIQLREAGIRDIYIVTGYKSNMFDYLRDKFNVYLRYNHEYAVRNNNSSIKTVEDIIGDTYICSADNYFTRNPFSAYEDDGYYAAVYSDGPTKEWCLSVDSHGYIDKVHIGGKACWYMLGHTFWDYSFSRHFIEILNHNYDLPGMADKLWENIYIGHLDELKLKIRKYPAKTIFEFDSLNELRQFDSSYINHTGSSIMASIAERMNIQEGEIIDICSIKGENNQSVGFTFKVHERNYRYLYDKSKIISPKNNMTEMKG